MMAQWLVLGLFLQTVDVTMCIDNKLENEEAFVESARSSSKQNWAKATSHLAIEITSLPLVRRYYVARKVAVIFETMGSAAYGRVFYYKPLAVSLRLCRSIAHSAAGRWNDESSPSSDSDGVSSHLFRTSTIPSSLSDSAISVSACTVSLADGGGNQVDDVGGTSASGELTGAKAPQTEKPQLAPSKKEVKRKSPLVKLIEKKLSKRKTSWCFRSSSKVINVYFSHCDKFLPPVFQCLVMV